MKKFVIRTLVFACALMATSFLMGSVEIAGFKEAVIAAIVFAIFNTVIKPVLVVLSLPVTILTLGLFSFVVNGMIFYMVSGVVSGFYVRSLMGAILGSFVVSFFNTAISNFLDIDKD